MVYRRKASPTRLVVILLSLILPLSDGFTFQTALFRHSCSVRLRPLFAEDKQKSSPYGRKEIKHQPHELSNQSRNGENLPPPKTTEQEARLATTDPLLLKRDRALLALHSSLGMDMVDAMNLLEDFPELYKDCPSLATRINYLLQELNMSKSKIKNLLAVHPSMMVRVLLDDPENNLSSTVELLQTELQLPLEEIVKTRLWQLDRMELRPKLAYLRHDLEMTTDDIVTMIRRSIHRSVMMHDLSELQEHVDFLLDGPIGEGLGSILRRGVSTERVTTKSEKRAIVLQRVRELMIKYPDVVAADIRPSVEYLQSIGCDSNILGRVAYRRPLLFYYKVKSLKQHLEFFAENLGLRVGHDPSTNAATDEKTVVDLMAVVPDIFTQSIPLNLEPKLRYFRKELGFDQAELRTIFVDRPQILALSLENNIIPKIDYLRTPVKQGGAGMTADGLRRLLVSCPQSLRESLTERIMPRCKVAVEKGYSILDDMPPKFLTMTDRMWDTWVEADFDETKLDQAKAALKTKRSRSK